MSKRILIVALLFAATAASAQTHRTAERGGFGCVSQDYHSRIIKFAVQKDTGVFTDALASGIISGQCVMFKPSEPVYLEDVALMSGLVQVRLQGKATAYWTTRETLSK